MNVLFRSRFLYIQQKRQNPQTKIRKTVYPLTCTNTLEALLVQVMYVQTDMPYRAFAWGVSVLPGEASSCD